MKLLLIVTLLALAACAAPAESPSAGQFALAETVQAAPTVVLAAPAAAGTTTTLRIAPIAATAAPLPTFTPRPLHTAAPTMPVPLAVPPAPATGPATTLTFAELYRGATADGPILADALQRLDGQRVTMAGYSAPPLNAAAQFFVLTRTPMISCPFCSSATEWPFDIVFVRMADGSPIPAVAPTTAIRVSGTLRVGTARDADTGFVSLIRIYADTVETTQ